MSFLVESGEMKENYTILSTVQINHNSYGTTYLHDKIHRPSNFLLAKLCRKKKKKRKNVYYEKCPSSTSAFNCN